MILFTILVINVLLLALFVVFVIAIGGSAAILVFGDVIVCVAIIVGIVMLIIEKRKK